MSLSLGKRVSLIAQSEIRAMTIVCAKIGGINLDCRNFPPPSMRTLLWNTQGSVTFKSGKDRQRAMYGDRRF